MTNRKTPKRNCPRFMDRGQLGDGVYWFVKSLLVTA
nr:MAG TPA: hypothetical protein [Caudoviricetes sp.]